jgi:hypothetical protein
VHPAGSVKTAIGKLYADHPNEPDIVERTLLDLGPIAVAPGEPASRRSCCPTRGSASRAADSFVLAEPKQAAANAGLCRGLLAVAERATSTRSACAP